MSDHKRNLDEMLNSPKSAQLIKDKTAIMELASSPDAKKLMQLLNQTGGAKLQEAAQAALGGDTSALMELMGKVMQRPEGVQAVEGINRSIRQK